MRASSAIAALVLLLVSATAFACNYCKNDSRSAVYTYEAVQKVKAQPDRLEFVVLKIHGKLATDDPAGIQKWLSTRPGVDPSTLKIAAIQKSIGFVFEKEKGLDALVADMTQSFPALQFEILHFDDDKTPTAPPSSP